MESVNVNSTVQLVVLGIFLITYILIFTEKMHRTTAALLGAALMVIVGRYFGILTPEDAIHMIEFEVIFLLAGMMMIVAVLMPTGFFEFLAIKSVKLAKGDPWRMMVILGTVTAVLSMFVDNVTTVLLMVPITVMIANTLRISAVPLLLSEALMSNVGGVGTLVGDPPNVMIAAATGFTFMDFIYNLMPVVIVSMVFSLYVLKFMYRDYISRVPENIDEIMKMNEYDMIKDPKTLKRTVGILLFTIFLFTIHHKIGLEPFEVALIGGTLAVLVNRVDPHKVLLEIEWSTLFFFAGLFVIVGTVDKVGILAFIAEEIASFVHGNYLLATILILWVSAIASAIVDNIPFTATMIPVIKHMEELGIKAEPIWWALAIGAGFGGNGTPIGSSAGVIVMGLSEKYGHRITFKEWIHKGTPVMVVSCIIGSIMLSLAIKYIY